jgi:hypothetical protein
MSSMPFIPADAGGPPPDLPPDLPSPGQPGEVTSPHTGGNLDFVRQAVLALQHFAELTADDVELAKVHSCITSLQKILADHAKDRESALGTTPAMRHVRRQSAGY